MWKCACKYCLPKFMIPTFFLMCHQKCSQKKKYLLCKSNTDLVFLCSFLDGRADCHIEESLRAMVHWGNIKQTEKVVHERKKSWNIKKYSLSWTNFVSLTVFILKYMRLSLNSFKMIYIILVLLTIITSQSEKIIWHSTYHTA